MAMAVTSDLWRVFNPLRLAGPIFDKELRVASRRKRTYLLRSAYIAVLLWFVVSAWGALARFQGSGPSSVVHTSRMGLAAVTVVTDVVWVQFVASLFLAIVLLSGAIGDEIRKRSLDVLLASPIGPLQIVLGKLFGRLLQVILLLSISLPLLAVLRVFGGVPWAYIVSSLCITLTATFLVGSLSLGLSVAGFNSHSVAVAAMALCLVAWGLVPWGVDALRDIGLIDPLVGQKALYLSNPFRVLASQSIGVFLPGQLAHGWLPHCFLMLMIAVVILVLSAWRVRPAVLAPVAGSGEVSSGTAAGASALGRLSCRAIRRVEGSPIVWRERKRPVLLRGWRGVMQAVLSLGVLGLAAVILIFVWMSIRGDPAVLCIMLAALLAVIFVFNVTSAAAASITREKEGRSIQVLLAIPYEEGKIVRDKAIGILRRNAPFLIPVPILGVVAWLSKAPDVGLDDAALIVASFCISLAGHTIFLMGLGFYLSVWLKTTTAATAMTFVLFFATKAFGSVFLLPMMGLVGGLRGLLASQIMQFLVYLAFARIVWHDAIQCLRANCQR
jgi:ABC-type transport system involved in multi-copper enzyme maturation permease subunit